MKESITNEFAAHACVAAVRGTPYGLADVCEVSDKLLRTLHPEMEHDHVESDNGCEMITYTERSQDLFEGYLSEIESALRSIGLEYDTYNSTWVVKKEPDDAKLV
ncbi:MAG: hypothetical protein VXZ72_02220 [Chlamydiota bacterium]|nr:hypothetical protein [Chlamydiota bacterium]